MTSNPQHSHNQPGPYVTQQYHFTIAIASIEYRCSYHCGIPLTESGMYINPSRKAKDHATQTSNTPVMSVRVQVVDWATKPTRKPKNDNEGNISAFANGYPEREEFYVWYFGRTQTGDSIALRVEGFNPYFYVKLPVGWNMQTMNRFIDAVCNKMPERDRQHMLTPEMVWRMDVYGFRNREQERFIHWRFKSDSARQAVRWIINELKDTFDRNLEIYEASIAAELQLSHAIGLVSWVDVPLAKTRLVTSGQSKAKFNYAVPWSHLRSVTGSEGDAVAPLVQMSVDIETFAEDFAGSDPKKPTDVIFQIAATLQTFTSKGEKDTTRHIFALEPCKLSDEPVDFQLYLCATEEALLMNFAKFVEKHDPDIIYSWNGDGFGESSFVSRSLKRWNRPNLHFFRFPLHFHSRPMASLSSVLLSSSVQTHQHRIHAMHCARRLQFSSIWIFDVFPSHVPRKTQRRSFVLLPSYGQAGEVRLSIAIR